MTPDILCIGSVLWDIIGRPDPRAGGVMAPGADVPGRIVQVPGGVALNVAVTLRRFGLRPALLSAVGQDAAGDALVASCDALGLATEHLHRAADPTDRYVAIEGADGLIGAIADTRTLEAAGARILGPLLDGALDRPWRGPVVIDGNLTEDLLRELAGSTPLALADLRVAPASPGKADRLATVLGHPSAAIYLNLEEAAALAGRPFAGAQEAACALLDLGAARALVTDGPRPAADGTPDGITLAAPRPVTARRLLGAGDAFMAAHIAAEVQGRRGEAALNVALDAASDHVAGAA